jgi:hypothetical protein
MNWEAAGAFAEIVGAIAVVVSLLYVAVQIRQNTKATRQQSYHDLVTRRAEMFFSELVRSREVANIFVNGLAGDPLDEVDSQRFVALMINFMSHFQDVYLQHASGIIENHVWLAERRILAAVISTPGFGGWWQAASQYFLPEFVGEVANVKPIELVSFDQHEKKWIRSTFETYGSPVSK